MAGKFTYEALKTEITIDSTAIGYAPHLASGSDNSVADLLNAVRVAVDVDLKRIDSADLQAAVVGSEYLALSAAQRALWDLIVSMPQIPLESPTIRGQITAVWPAGTSTRTNLVALQTKKGSRAELLWGDGTFISSSDIALAKAIP